MNWTLQNMLAKCVNDEQNNWSTQLPYVMTAYRTTVHESTGYTPHFLVYGQEICLPIDFMYPNPNDHLPSSTNEFVSARKLAFQKAYKSTRSTLNQSQKRRNALYTREVHGPLYQEGQKVLLHSPVVPVGKSPKFFLSMERPIRYHTRHKRCHISYWRPVDQQTIGSSLWPLKAFQGTSTDVKCSHQGCQCQDTIANAKPGNNSDTHIIRSRSM